MAEGTARSILESHEMLTANVVLLLEAKVLLRPATDVRQLIIFCSCSLGKGLGVE